MKILLFLLLFPIIAFSQVKAFPAAYGAGSATTGARGAGESASVYVVTNLNNSGAGSFRDGWASNTYIVFSVSGTIELDTPLSGAVSNVTVAGQTAPAGGITFTTSYASPNSPIIEISSCSNLIWRYVKFRRQHFDGTEQQTSNQDDFQCNNCNDIIIDHCSASWAADEAFDFPGTSKRVTVQYSILAETSTGTTAGNVFSTGESYSYLRNMFVNVSHRTPSVSPDNQVDAINNVIHNWNNRAAISAANSITNHNFIGNYMQPGKSKASSDKNWLDVRDAWITGNSQDVRVYSYNNYWPGVQETPDVIDYNPLWIHRFALTTGPCAGVAQFDPACSSYKSLTQFPLLGEDITILSPQAAKTEVEDNAGANATIDGSGNVSIAWDDVDTNLRNQVINNTWFSYSYPINPQSLSYYISFFASVSSTPINTRGTYSSYDSDSDGMPDVWETAEFGDLDETATGDFNADGYDNIEGYLNLVDNSEVIAVTGITWDNDTQTIGTGETVDLAVTFAPTNATDKGVTYSSDSTDDLSNAGVWVSEGSANFTVTTDDGSFTDIMAVTTSAATIPVTGVSITPSSATIDEPDTEQLTETYTPTNADDKTGVWSSSNSALASVDQNGLVTGVAISNDMVQNGGFDSETSWNLEDAAWTISGGTASCDGTQVSAKSVYQNIAAVADRSYFVTFTVSNYSAGNVKAYVGGFDSGPNVSANGTYTHSITTSTYFDANLWIQGDANFIGDIDNVDVFEFPLITYTTNDGGFTDTSEITVISTPQANSSLGGFTYGADNTPYIYINSVKKRIKN